MIGGTDFIGELDLNFLAQQEFESTDGTSDFARISVLCRNLLRVLMRGWTASWRQLITKEVAQAVFMGRNPEFLRQFRFEFQQGFFHVFQQLKDQDLSETQQEQVQLYLSNCLSLLPYSDLNAYEAIKIPQYIGGQWELVEYQVKPLELTQGTEKDDDRVFAYGLEPLFQRKAESHLIFMGTTYPAGQGFLSQIKADAKGFESVGKSLYKTGRSRIHSWLEHQENKTHVCGTSLGGSLSLLLAIDQGNYQLSRVDALNPAGLHDARRKSQFDRWDEQVNKPQVVVQKQGDDPVSAFGIWKEDWTILHVAPPQDKKGPNRFWDHVVNYAGLKGAQFTYCLAQEDNAQRKRRNFWLFSLGRGFIYYSILVPYTYLIRPAIQFFVRHWPLLIILPCLVLVASLGGAGILTGAPFVAAVSILMVAAVAIVLARIIKDASEPSKRFAKMHDPALPRNKDMDIYDPENSLDIELTYREINSYYKCVRASKGKEFLPVNEKMSKYVAGITKKSLLEDSELSENAERRVSLHVTKAKAAHMRHSLMLIHKLGIENHDRLQILLKEQHQEYCLGKHPVI